MKSAINMKVKSKGKELDTVVIYHESQKNKQCQKSQIHKLNFAYFPKE